MANPATLAAFIGGLVSVLTVYMTYRVRMKQTKQLLLRERLTAWVRAGAEAAS